MPNRESGLTPMEFSHGRGRDRGHDCDRGRGRGYGRGHENGVGNNDAYDNNDDGSLPPPVNLPEGAEKAPAAPNIDAGPLRSGRQRKPVRGSLYLNDDDTNFTLISPVGSVDGELDDENTTTLLGRVELKK